MDFYVDLPKAGINTLMNQNPKITNRMYIFKLYEK